MKGLCGVKRVSEDQVRTVIAPEPTKTWNPISHNILLNIVENSLLRNNLKISQKSFQLSHENHRFFGVYDLIGGFEHDDFGLSLGIRNSTDQRFPAGLAFGTKVFVCSNLMFEGDEVVSRKHTRFILDDMPLMVNNIIDNFLDRYLGTCHQIAYFKGYEISENEVKAFLWDISKEVLPYNFVKNEVFSAWKDPKYTEHQENTVWRLYNAITAAMKIRQKRNPYNAAFETQAVSGLLKQCWPLQNVA
ncbi:MAG: hypothetical protein KAI43_10335 [Candidatus Aureabacteria bacterium]|nr:hypothetical protein [Candidatus Auribacterota bacterium]